MTIRIKRIDTEVDLRRSFSVREAVYIIEQQIDREEEFDQYEEESRHFVALDGEVPVGAARWRYTGEGAKLERFAVIAPYRKKGIASQLVGAVIDDIRNHESYSGQKLYLNAQLSAMPLYRKFGFVPVGPTFLECDIVHQKMELFLS